MYQINNLGNTWEFLRVCRATTFTCLICLEMTMPEASPSRETDIPSENSGLCMKMAPILYQFMQNRRWIKIHCDSVQRQICKTCKQYKIKLCQIKHVALSAVVTSLWQVSSWKDQSRSTTEYKVRFLQKNLMKLLMLIFLVNFHLINKSMTFHERWKTIPNLCMVVYMTTHTSTHSQFFCHLTWALCQHQHLHGSQSPHRGPLWSLLSILSLCFRSLQPP